MQMGNSMVQVFSIGSMAHDMRVSGLKDSHLVEVNLFTLMAALIKVNGW